MSLQNANDMSSFVQHRGPLVHRHPLTAPCMVLPPIRSAPAMPFSGTLSLSDCSDLSVSSREDAALMVRRYAAHNAAIANCRPAPCHFASVEPASSPSLPALHPTQPASNPLPHSFSVHATLINDPRNKAVKGQTKASAKVAYASRSDSGVRTQRRITKKVRSSKSNIPGESRYWTPSEHKLFVEALLRYGSKNLKAISAHVGTRNMIQCRTHEQKCFMRLMREAQRDTFERTGEKSEAGYSCVVSEDRKGKQPKDVYSVPSSCGIALLCVVSEELTRALQS